MRAARRASRAWRRTARANAGARFRLPAQTQVHARSSSCASASYEHVLPLAGGDRGGAQDPRRVVRPRAARRRRRIGAGRDDPHGGGVDAERRNARGGVLAGGDDAGAGGQRPPLRSEVPRAPACVEASLVRQQQMRQRHQPQAAGGGARRRGERTQRQTVDHHACAVRQPLEHADQAGAGARAAARKPARQRMDRDAPTQAPQAVHDARVVDVAAGALIERAGHDDVQRRIAHSGPS